MHNPNAQLSRRIFVGGLGASAVTAPALVQHAHAVAANDDEMTVDEMDAMHKESHQSFPAATEGVGNQPLEHTLDGDVKVFELDCGVFEWEYRPGEYAEAWGYNGMVPGPEIRVTEGDKVRFLVTNNLPESTSVHWHGLILPNGMDGIPFITQSPIKPGETFTYSDLQDDCMPLGRTSTAYCGRFATTGRTTAARVRPYGRQPHCNAL